MHERPIFVNKKDEKGVIVIFLYIDDTLCVGNKNALKKFKKDIKMFFVTKEEGGMMEYVGCMIKKNQDIIYQSNKKIERLFGKDIENMRNY